MGSNCSYSPFCRGERIQGEESPLLSEKVIATLSHLQTSQGQDCPHPFYDLSLIYQCPLNPWVGPTWHSQHSYADEVLTWYKVTLLHALIPSLSRGVTQLFFLQPSPWLCPAIQSNCLPQQPCCPAGRDGRQPCAHPTLFCHLLPQASYVFI